MMKKIVAILFLLTSCTSFQMPETFKYQIYQTPGFDISTWQKITTPKASYHIYIEGDGYAFNAHGLPTTDPTPKGTLMRQMALKDNFANVVYVARPCQYTKGSKCSKKYWTTDRFAPEVIDAEYQAIKDIVGKAPVVLIGFSGGAQVAGLIAATKDLNVQKVITIAGNLDHKTWTNYHRLPPLTGSLNLADFKDRFSGINQVHYVGSKDTVIPPFLAEEFTGDKSSVRVVEDATHGKGWDDVNLFNN